MAKRVVDDASLTTVADAIRERAGVTGELEFPNGMAEAVGGIPNAFPMLYSLIDRSITEIEDENLITIGSNTFSNCTKLKRAYLPNVTSINGASFQNCSALVDVTLPSLIWTGNNGMQGCGFTTLDLPKCQRLNGSMFVNCTKLTALILRSTSQVCTLASIDVFKNTPVESGAGYVYVPRSMVDSHKVATNWTTFANQLLAVEDYTIDGTVNGTIIPWSHGGYDANGSANTTANRLRTNTFIPNNVATVSVNSGFQFIPVCYGDDGSNLPVSYWEDGELTANGKWYTSVDFNRVFSISKNVKLILRKTDNSAISVHDHTNVIYTFKE